MGDIPNYDQYLLNRLNALKASSIQFNSSKYAFPVLHALRNYAQIGRVITRGHDSLLYLEVSSFGHLQALVSSNLAFQIEDYRRSWIHL